MKDVLRGEEELSVKKLTRIASRLFVQASMEYPASVPCIAADIANKCRGQSYYPLRLWGALKEDYKKIKDLTVIANRLHENSVKKIKVFTPYRMGGVMEQVFSQAQQMSYAGEEDLKKFLSSYQPGVESHLQAVHGALKLVNPLNN